MRKKTPIGVCDDCVLAWYGLPHPAAGLAAAGGG